MAGKKRGPPYAFNQGTVRYYAPERAHDGSTKPSGKAMFTHRMYFNYIGIRQEEHWSARQRGVKIAQRIETLRDMKLKSGQVAVIGGEQYAVGRIFHGLNKQGVKISDVTLEEPARLYEIKEHE
jgi:hypothetical protein